jgi:hypothetical protein
METNEMIEQCAAICHEVNRAYCRAIGDDSQVSWEEAMQWQRDSSKSGVSSILFNPGIEASGLHELWRKHKEAEGWKYGPVKDVEKKEHPCLRPYGELPLEQRVKDHLFRAVVKQMTKYYYAEEMVEESK